MAGEAGGSTERQRAFLRFRVGRTRLAVPAESVEEVVERSEITPIPCAPPHVTGLIAVRGDAVPVFDVARFLGLEGEDADPDRDPRVLVVRSSRYRVGLSCDLVTGLVTVAASRIEEPHACQPASLREHALGETLLDGAVLPLLDLDALLEAGRAR